MTCCADHPLRNKHGESIDPKQPFPVASMEGLLLTSKSQTFTYNGKAAAGAVTVNATTHKPIYSIEGDQVASYWGIEENRVYSAFADRSWKKEGSWLLSVVETNGSAAFSVYNPTQNLEEMFESVTGTVKRFVARVKDIHGAYLYGWIRGVSVSSDVYTFEVFNKRLTEGNQNWVGTLGSFDNTALERIEIFRYNSSLVFGTGTTLTEEVGCPKEFSKDWESQLRYAETLSNGQYFVDYMRGRVMGVKADTTASETVTYNVLLPVATATVTLETSDIEIGAVELKDGTTDTRGVVNAANTARTTATPTVVTQIVDPAGRVVYAASPNLKYGFDATGQDSYATIVTASAECHHMIVTNEGTNPVEVSIDGGVTNNARLAGGASKAFDDLVIANGANVQARNYSAGNNYTNLTIEIW